MNFSPCLSAVRTYQRWQNAMKSDMHRHIMQIYGQQRWSWFSQIMYLIWYWGRSLAPKGRGNNIVWNLEPNVLNIFEHGRRHAAELFDRPGIASWTGAVLLYGAIATKFIQQCLVTILYCLYTFRAKKVMEDKQALFVKAFPEVLMFPRARKRVSLASRCSLRLNTCTVISTLAALEENHFKMFWKIHQIAMRCP